MPKLIVISGPSGCGKTTIAKEILARHPEIAFSVSATTRSRRPTEEHGKDYFFLSREDFQRNIQRGELIEWEEIYGDYYGSLNSEVQRAFGSNRSLLFDIDVNGALSIKRKFGAESLLIFIKPPSIEVLATRLRRRKTESEEAVRRRLERASMELGRAPEFDYAIVNDDLQRAVERADEIIRREVLTQEVK